MTIVILLLSIGFVFLSDFLEKKNEENDTDACCAPVVASGVVGGIGLVGSLVAIVILSVTVSQLGTIDDRIEMYQSENTKIENRIAECVQEYQKHEIEIVSEVSPDNAITMVALYPELKSDELVKKQIEVYIENNEKIKELKEDKIYGDVYRWWLYFGGSGK